jgi:hypothetical protein
MVDTDFMWKVHRDPDLERILPSYFNPRVAAPTAAIAGGIGAYIGSDDAGIAVTSGVLLFVIVYAWMALARRVIKPPS